ncbi:MAG: hypothetical protein H7832_00725 [Magnetococcus sp. DMHC-6]
MQKIFVQFATILSVIVLTSGSLLAGSLQGNLIKQREEMQKNSGAYGDTSYQYCDDKEINEQIRQTKQAGGKTYNLCNQTIDNNNNKKKIVNYVDTNKEIKINKLAGEDPDVNVGQVDVLKGTNIRNKKINTTVHTQGIEVK